MVIESRSAAAPTGPPEPRTTAAEAGDGDGVAVDPLAGVDTAGPLGLPGLPDKEDVPPLGDADDDTGLTTGGGVGGCWVGCEIEAVGAGGGGVGGGGGGGAVAYSAAVVLGGEYAHGALHAARPWPAPLFGFCCGLAQSMLPALGVNAYASHAWNRI